jgi:hypothetical protein
MMDRLRIVVGFSVSAIMVASSLAHSVLSWKLLQGRLENTHATPDLISSLAIGWYWGGAAMFVLGVVVLVVFVQFLRNRSSSLVPTLIIGFGYMAFGIWAVAVSHNPFFLVFVIPGLLLLVTSWRAPRAEIA